MNRPNFKSGLASEMNKYLDHKVAAGFKETSYYTHLRLFDQYCYEEGIFDLRFTKEDSVKWIKKRDQEATTTHYSRINSSKNFLIYLAYKGIDVYVIRDIAFKPTDFQPHIYSVSEVERYFYAVDTFYSSYAPKDSIQYPVLFRILYSCGTRINETIGIRKCDVDLELGIIKLFETKNNMERYVVLREDLRLLMLQYANKCFYMIKEDGYVFTNTTGTRLQAKTVYERHRLFLKVANIPYIGNNEGPRIHDWRHHMAVYCFKQLIDSGVDMYVALPRVSTYLGHKTIYATEKYLRLTMELFPYIEEQFSDKIQQIFGEDFHETN